MARYFYRFDASTELGKKFRSLWNECVKAERAAESFAKKAGAKTYYSSPSAFAGGVECVSFEDGVQVNTKLWRSLGKDADGLEQWVPDVKYRSDVMVLPRKDFKPSDTATRIYDRRQMSWAMVRHMHTVAEWLEMAGMKPGGDREKDAVRLDEQMEQTRFVKYIELYRDDEIPVDPTHPQRKAPYYIRESIRIERARLQLPVVRTERLYHLLQADQSVAMKDGKPTVVHDMTPTFFEYNKRFYLGIDYPCGAEGLTEISSKAYMTVKEDVLRMQRDLEALEKRGGVN